METGLEARIKQRVRAVVRELRARDLTQEQVQHLTGVSQGDVSRIENDDERRGSVRAADIIIERLGVSPEYFYSPGEVGSFERWRGRGEAGPTPWEQAVQRYCAMQAADAAPVSRAQRAALSDPRNNAPGDSRLVQALHGALLTSGGAPERSTTRPKSPD